MVPARRQRRPANAAGATIHMHLHESACIAAFAKTGSSLSGSLLKVRNINNARSHCAPTADNARSRAQWTELQIIPGLCLALAVRIGATL
eukprot:5482545-Amphidinium_carterae.1